MSDSKTVAAERTVGNAPAAQDKTKQARSLTYGIFLAIFILWIYSLWADRVTPMTDMGRVNGEVIRLAPQVSGPVASIHVANNDEVAKGQLLVTIEKAPFELEEKAAELALQKATQSYHADSASIDVAKGNEAAARAAANNARMQVERYRALLKKGTISRAAMDDSLTQLQTAEANLAQTVSALEKARFEIGPRGEENPEIQAVLNKRAQARLNLEHTELKAPANGVITNMTLAKGNYASAGQPLLTFINTEQLWLTAMVRENSLAYLKRDDAVKVVFDAYPGQVFSGKITSIGFGSSGNGSLQVNASTGLLDSPTSQPSAQRFPVNVQFDDLPPGVNPRFGGRSVVVFYPGESYLGERLADIWIWAWSYISYVS
ncbi:HlyD family secretion protein [Aeromonas hydrophila]|uniref:HlyD family secretion protein n=1 Tax=Aeromonas hydrophila TaxID=644 RepID=UPI0005DA3EB9|nr:HlyD family secretion protein [Aeromonas hydrophila]AKA17781.1 hemolysin D [Aeromonas hydrophila]KWR68603.1 hemolysin D [Aeromonas hydrophila]MBW3810915.1 HlyD family secretion protein [Aeromonas hydrophila]MCO4201283.1 HlyD family secretion protein [Aeromonas hydrophila]UNB60282.1 HlyD family secretion protein [Aeromonas hydrophila]